jgi:BMFP domain-containing protein YqiC
VAPRGVVGAAAVWELCDGSTTLEEIVRQLAAAHPDHARVIGEDVKQTVRKLAELGLVTDAASGEATDTRG